LDICTSPVEQKPLPCRSTFTLYPKTLQFIKALIPTLTEPGQAKFFSSLGMTAWKQNANGEQNKAGFSVLSPARIHCVSWEESKWKPIPRVCEYTDTPV